MVRSLVLSALLLQASPMKDPLAQARREYDAAEYSRAARTLVAASNLQGLSRERYLELLELNAFVQGSLGHAPAARKAFTWLLFLEPDFKLDRRWSPRIQTAFFEAKGELEAIPPLEFRLRGGSPTASLWLGADPLKLARDVRLHVQAPGQPERVEVRPASPGVAMELPAPVGARVWAELLGEREDVLAVAVQEAALRPSPGPTSSLATSRPPVQSSSVSPVVYGLLGGGLVSLGVGIALGLAVRGDQRSLANAQRDAAGRITSVSQRDAFARAALSSKKATAANILGAVGCAGIAAGVGVYFLAPATRSGAQAPGVSVAGAF